MPNANGSPLRTLRASWRARHGLTTGRSAKITLARIVSALTLECRATDARVKAVIRQSTPRNRIAFPRLYLSPDDLRVGAWCRPDHKQGEYCIVMNPGVLMAIDDLALAAASLPQFLVPDRAAFDLPSERSDGRASMPFQDAGYATIDPNRFWDYSACTRHGQIDPALLTFSMPLDHWRLQQAGVIAELAIA